MTLNKIKTNLLSYILLSLLLIAGCSGEDKFPVESFDEVLGGVMINPDETKQYIQGFGGVNMPGWIPDMTNEQISLAFGTGTGQIGLSILRIRVPYDPGMFNLELPAAQKARLLGAAIIASPWTPPAWMKSNNNIVGGNLNRENYADYASHLKSFNNYMLTNGVPLYAVSLQNEPDVNVNYESCSWNSSQMLKFVKEYAPSIGTKIIIPESYNFSSGISDAILNDPLAAANVAIIGGHLYGGGIRSYPLAALKGKELWMTEHLSLDTTWYGAFLTGKEINDCMSAGMNAYLWWYIRRYYGPIDDKSNVTKRGYIISQYARFIRPGCVRVYATPVTHNTIYTTAYKNGAKIVIVVLNTSYEASVEQIFAIKNCSVNSFTRYVTSETKNCVKDGTVRVTNGKFNVSLGMESITTFVSD